MRLIDADEFIITTKVGVMLASMCTNNEAKKEILKAAYELIKERIDDAPTVDAVPLRYGKWIKRFGNRYMFCIYDCSECKYPNPTKTEYCPKCGAKMDGGDENA